MTKRERVVARALELLRDRPAGFRYAELVSVLGKELPDIKVATIRSSIWDLDKRIAESVYKPGPGLFRHTSFRVDS